MERRGIKREKKQEKEEEEVTRTEIKKAVKKEVKSKVKQEEEEVQIIDEEEEVTGTEIKKEVKKEVKSKVKQEEEEVQIIYEEERKETNKTWMTMALEFAEEGLKRGEVPVGCLFIYRNEVIASEINTVNETKNSTRHAEMNCIETALKWASSNNIPPQQVFKDLKVVVTVEPCIMCAAAMMDFQIPEIIYGCKNNRFGGCQSIFKIKSFYKNSKCVIKGGIYADKAIALLKSFYKGENPNAPKSKVMKKQS